jgi:hypothetical protein
MVAMEKFDEDNMPDMTDNELRRLFQDIKEEMHEGVEYMMFTPLRTTILSCLQIIKNELIARKLNTTRTELNQMAIPNKIYNDELMLEDDQDEVETDMDE